MTAAASRRSRPRESRKRLRDKRSGKCVDGVELLGVAISHPVCPCRGGKHPRSEITVPPLRKGLRGCHGLVPWSFTLVAITSDHFFLDATGLSRGDSRSLLTSGQREPPGDKPVASASTSGDCSRQRDSPRREAVASFSQLMSSLQSHNPRKSNLSATEYSAPANEKIHVMPCAFPPVRSEKRLRKCAGRSFITLPC